MELLDVGALGVLRRHDPRADDLDGARAAPVAASHLRVCTPKHGRDNSVRCFHFHTSAWKNRSVPPIAMKRAGQGGAGAQPQRFCGMEKKTTAKQTEPPRDQNACTHTRVRSNNERDGRGGGRGRRASVTTGHRAYIHGIGC